MNPERWQQINDLFHAALEREPGECAAFLDETCGGDEALRKQVEALLAGHEKAGSFIESPAMEVEARRVAAEQESSKAEIFLGETISHYRVISPLGSGGMGEVYLAEDTVLGRKIALKLLPPGFTRDPDRVRRFQQEARAASALNHPNIITIHEIGQVDQRHFIATEFIDGETLRQHIRVQSNPVGDDGKSGTALSLREVLNIAIQAADALAVAHEASIVHRDIKPENIMVRRRDNYIKVLDFGLAKLTEGVAGEIDTEGPTRAQFQTSAGLVMGTVAYMSPEQTRGERLDARTDIWSLGVVLYEMVAGCVPFDRPTPSEVIALILERAPLPLTHHVREAPVELERIVSKALTKDKELRYQTAKDFLGDLQRLRRRLDFEAEIGRTAEPHEQNNEEKAVAAGREQKVVVTAEAATRERGAAAVAHSSALVKGVREHRLGWLIALAALLGVTAVAAYFAYSRFAARSRAGTVRFVAVMPLANTSSDLEMEYLSDGISQSLINNLSQLSGVKVIASSSSFKYKGKDADPQEVANALGVDAILTGAVTQRGDNLLISVDLMDVHDKTQVWGAQYNRKATDLLAIQSDISREIASALRLKLTNAERQELAKRETTNPQAYELLLKARFNSLGGGAVAQKKAIEYYLQAIAVDPTYALAYAELSMVYAGLASDSTLDPKEGLPKAEDAARKALELDESLAEAHLALATIKLNAWEWTTAEREFKRAIELNQNLSTAHHGYASYLTDRGRHEEAAAEMKRARELDPLSLVVNLGVGVRLYGARQYDQAIAAFKKTLELDKNYAPAHVFLGYTYAAKRMYPEAIAAYQQFIKLSGDDSSMQVFLGIAYAKSGQRAKALAILKRLQTKKEYVSPGELADLYVALGEQEQAFASLEKAYSAHDLQLQYLGVDQDLDPLRSDPRFADLMRRVGLSR
jgi:serine/threonine protein kinase/TolB-like protein/Flp pilus assembly protein TadD